MAVANEATYESVYMGATHAKRWKSGTEKKHNTVANFVMSICAKMVVTLHTITSSSSKLKKFNFFLFLFFLFFFFFFAHLKFLRILP